MLQQTNFLPRMERLNAGRYHDISGVETTSDDNRIRIVAHEL